MKTKEKEAPPTIPGGLFDLNSARAILQTPYSFKVKNDKTGDVREFMIKPPTYGTLLKVTEEMALIDVETIMKSDNSLDLFKEYADTLLRVVCFVISGDGTFNQETYNFIKWNTTVSDVYELFVETSVRLNVKDFRNTIIAGHTMSLSSQREKIARLTLGSS